MSFFEIWIFLVRYCKLLKYQNYVDLMGWIFTPLIVDQEPVDIECGLQDTGSLYHMKRYSPDLFCVDLLNFETRRYWLKILDAGTKFF